MSLTVLFDPLDSTLDIYTNTVVFGGVHAVRRLYKTSDAVSTKL